MTTGAQTRMEKENLGGPLRLGCLAVNRLKGVIRDALPMSLQRTLGKVPGWSIGLYRGPSPLDLGPMDGVANPVISYRDVTDVPAVFVADPFAINIAGTWHLYFEVMNGRTRRGEIGLATSANLHRWKYEGIVLAEPFHLSYPHIIEWQGSLYMVPESWEDGTVRLYRANDPDRWSLVDVLLKGSVLLDSSPFRYSEHWWMFTETNEQHGFDTLRLYYASQLQGPWSEHPCSPVVRGDASAARPAGKVINWQGQLIRYGQDCSVEYGAKAHAFEVTMLTTDEYAEQLAQSSVLQGTGNGWNESCMHHVDAHEQSDGSWLAFVDGY